MDEKEVKRFELRLPLNIHEKLRRESFEMEISMHEIVMGLIKEHYNKGE